MILRIFEMSANKNHYLSTLQISINWRFST